MLLKLLHVAISGVDFVMRLEAGLDLSLLGKVGTTTGEGQSI